MASIYRPGTGRTYRIAFTDQHGRRRTCGGYRDKAATQALAAKIEQDAQRLRAGLEPQWPALTLVVLLGQLAPAQRPIAEAIEAWIDDGRRRDWASITIRENRRKVTTFARSCAWQDLASVRADDAARHLGQLAAQDRHPRTVAAYLAALTTFLRWCVAQGWLERSPLAGLARSPEHRDRTRRAFTAAEFAALASSCKPRHHALYLVAGLSGLRKIELKRLERRDIDPGPPPAWQLRAKATKSRRADAVAMLPECWEVLAPLVLKANGPTARVFPEICSWMAFGSDLKRAGVQQTDDQGRKLDFHSFRYFFCSELARRLDIQTVRLLMRHRDIRTTMNLYADLGLKDTRAAVAKLPRLLQPPPPAGQEEA